MSDKICSCGEPMTLEVVHRKDSPCFLWTEAPASGRVVVPAEPTDKMLEAMAEKHWSIDGCQLCKQSYVALYKAMLRAAGSRHE